MSAAAWMINLANPASPTYVGNMDTQTVNETAKNATEASTQLSNGDATIIFIVCISVLVAISAFFLIEYLLEKRKRQRELQ